MRRIQQWKHAAATGVLLWSAGIVAGGGGFTRIERWVGAGTNRAALVVDWHDGTPPHALAWGFRWNGTATGRDLWRAVTNADPGLSGVYTNATDGQRLTAITYRRPHRPGDRLPGTGRHADTRWTAYTRDHTGAVARAGTWTDWTASGARGRSSDFRPCTNDLSTRVLTNNSWDAWSRGTNGTPVPPGGWTAALHYPFADSVVVFDAGDSPTYPDWISGELFTNAAATLGRPTVDTTGDGLTIPLDQAVPLVPVAPAFRAFELVKISASGFLTLAFDHRVLDHPDNPYGLDFTVFGNSWQRIDGGGDWTNGDPSATAINGARASSYGRVSVSQDATNWYAFTNGPYADDFAPTVGRVYDPSNTVAGLGSWNHWWGGATDATVPVAPAMVPLQWEGMSVAAIARRYRGGAGGTSFDIGDLPLAADPNTGRKWIRYVRIERGVEINPDVDAIADVSPARPCDRWRSTHFAWMSDPADEREGSDPDGDGRANVMEYALGGSPRNAVASPVFAAALCATGAVPIVRVCYQVDTTAVGVAVAIVRNDDLRTHAWRTNGVGRPYVSGAVTNHMVPLCVDVPVHAGASAVRMRVRYDD